MSCTASALQHCQAILHAFADFWHVWTLLLLVSDCSKLLILGQSETHTVFPLL